MLKLLAAINRHGCWIFMTLTLLFILTGLDMAKRLWNPHLAQYLHTEILPIPFYILLAIHGFFPLRNVLLRGSLFKSEKTATFYAYAVCCILLALFLWLQLR